MHAVILGRAITGIPGVFLTKRRELVYIWPSWSFRAPRPADRAPDDDRPSSSRPPRTGTRSRSFWKRRGSPTRSIRQILAGRTSSSRDFWRFCQATAFRQSSIKIPVTAARQCLFSNPAQFSSISPRTVKFLPQDCAVEKVLDRLFWQIGGLGRMAGQNHHFKQYAGEKLAMQIERYVNETNRLYGVLTAPSRPRFCRGGLLDCGHGGLSVDCPARKPRPNARRFFASEGVGSRR